MPAISTAFKFSILSHPRIFIPKLLSPGNHSAFRNSSSWLQLYTSIANSRTTLFSLNSSGEESGVSEAEDEWLQKLPDKKKPLYSHSLPCVEAWLRNLGFYQSRDDRAVWFVEKPNWHAQLSLDVTDLYIRYLKVGPGNLDKDIERRFSYALSREDIENAILGGP
ncbi:uncharacterized protein LOC127256139 [Andrographis paniculata]|uniref:uncharacterized protein LOC127256139 n=1 Tax=Andrographis paniculata TaxID=175694 RepID=UPI0021E81BD4|nr:uncharacterized protein LOC127256139 [Andrographis paniculata]